MLHTGASTKKEYKGLNGQQSHFSCVLQLLHDGKTYLVQLKFKIVFFPSIITVAGQLLHFARRTRKSALRLPLRIVRPQTTLAGIGSPLG